MTKNLFLRRFRFMVGGTLFKYFEYFFQVDYPNLFKLDLSDTMAIDKNAPGLNIQDAFVTFKALGELIKIDAGFMLPPLSHNSLESAAKLYGNDYFANSFRRNLFSVADPFKSDGESPVGRDAGVQARVLVLNGHINVRAGAYMGHRVSLVPVRHGPVPDRGTEHVPAGGCDCRSTCSTPSPGSSTRAPISARGRSFRSAASTISSSTHPRAQESGKYQIGAVDLLVNLPARPWRPHRAGQRRAVGRRHLPHAAQG